MNNTKVKCTITVCEYNTACCIVPNDSINTYCKKDNISLNMEDDTCLCQEYKYDENKKYECNNCQIEKYGKIKLYKEIDLDDFTLIEVEDPRDLL